MVLSWNPKNLNLVGFSDADWGSQVDDRKSTSGVVFSIGGGLVSWKCKKQKTVALSSMEAEYQALAIAIQELLFLVIIFDEGIEDKFGTTNNFRR